MTLLDCRSTGERAPSGTRVGHSREIRHRLRRAVRAGSAVLYAGDEVYCPCCQRNLRTFVGSAAAPNKVCPACGSRERQRLLILYLIAHTTILTSPTRLLHFAPEQCLHDRFRAAPRLEYVTADLRGLPLVDKRMDITETHLPDESVDIIVCSHVLEHVDNDAKALREMRRILRVGGKAFLQHPIDAARRRTFEDASIVGWEERSRAFGQGDHMRIYGRDFAERARSAGLAVECVPYRDRFSPEDVDRYGLRDGGSLRADDIYVCSKSTRLPSD
jgi:SAM-dependent methyltransferase